MKAPEPELTHKQRRALAALVAEPTLTRAAQVARVSEVTLYRWLRQPAFASAHSQAVGETFRAALGAVQQASQQAIQTLLDVMSDAAAAVCYALPDLTEQAIQDTRNLAGAKRHYAAALGFLGPRAQSDADRLRREAEAHQAILDALAAA